MRKIVCLVLTVLLTIAVFATVAFTKARKEENIHKPAYLQKLEPVTGSGEFPEVVLPRVKAVRPAAEDFQREILDKKGWTKEKLEEIKSDVLSPESEPLEQEPFYCRVRNQEGSCCYYNDDRPYWYCYGQIGYATYLDLDKNYFTNCPYPLYPFGITNVQMFWYAEDAVTIIAEGRIYSVDYSDGSYPDSQIFRSAKFDTLNFVGGFGSVNINLRDTFCVYEPFFAAFMFMNSDDFLDTVYCPSATQMLKISPLWENSGRQFQCYWGPYTEFTGEPYYGWFDVVTNGIASGVMRIEVFGYTADQNDCPPPQETWYYKNPYEPYAPCGVPDFNQYQMPGQAFCGPTAGANSIWWFAARGDFEPSWGGFDPTDVPNLINELAILAGTNPINGTECDSLQDAIIQTVYNHGGWYFEETTVYAPDFWYLQKELRDCEDVILLLGFWQTTDGGSTWHRFGGHFVSLAGVDIFNLKFALSDPALDNHEVGGSLGIVCGTHTPANDPIDHNTGITSYDAYIVAWPSVSPGGTLYLPDYLVDWADFQDQNFRTVHQIYHSTYDQAYPVAVEIEQAIVVSPGLKEFSEQVNSSKAYEIENNHGGIEAFDVSLGAGYTYGLYYGSFIAGTSQLDLNCDYGDYYPASTFVPSGLPVIDTFTITGKAGNYSIQQVTYKFTHRSYPELKITKYAFGFWVPEGGVENCEYVIEDVFVMENASSSDFIGLQTGMLFDYDIGASNACDVDFDQKHQSMWMWEDTAVDTVFGLTKVPAVAGDMAMTGWGLNNDGRIYDGQYFDSLKIWMESGTWQVDYPGITDDKSLLIADKSFDLIVGQKHLEKWIKWGYGNPILTGGDINWRQFLYDVLHQQGYFRGDVNQDRKLSISDIVYLVHYLMRSGAEPYEFVDQGNVNNDDSVSVSDIVYLINNLFKFGPAPIDRNRFFIQSPYVDSTYKSLGIREPGLFGEPDWMNLGR
ncbi:MAG: dockerin type I repeat-containing protein [candidate division Zixibacteria bacterium]|nr:dockerin type I repeat-containing protein [candidate division Zixibacteria bacterium]